MDRSNKYHADAARGISARALLENKTLVDAFREIREHYVSALVSAPLRDVEGMQKIKMMIGTVDKLKETLEVYVSSGKVAEKELSWLERAKKKLRVV